MVIASFIISIVSIFIVSVTFWWKWKIHNAEVLKFRILNYVYEFYQPTYLIEKLPTTINIIEHFNKNHKKNKTNTIIYLLMQLNHEELIMIVTDLDRDFNNVCWKPNIKNV